MKSSTEFQLDGREYSVSMFPPSQSLKILARLLKIAGVPLSKMAEAKSLDMEFADIAKEVLPKMISELCMRLDEKEIVSIIDELFTTVKCTAGEGESGTMPIKMDMHFHGRLASMLKMVGKVLEVQYRDFLADLGANAGFLKKMMERTDKMSPVQTTSSGQSGG